MGEAKNSFICLIKLNKDRIKLSLAKAKMLKVEVCAFSGLKIYPGHGKRVCRADGKTQIFLSGKCERNHALKRNPRKINWTVLYRRKHRKGMVEETSKKRTRRTQKFMRAVTGATLADIMAKRNQKPEVRNAQREQAVRAAKEKKEAKEAKKEKKVDTGKAKVPKAAKPTKPAAPKMKRKGAGGKR